MTIINLFCSFCVFCIIDTICRYVCHYNFFFSYVGMSAIFCKSNASLLNTIVNMFYICSGFIYNRYCLETRLLLENSRKVGHLLRKLLHYRGSPLQELDARRRPTSKYHNFLVCCSHICLCFSWAYIVNSHFIVIIMWVYAILQSELWLKNLTILLKCTSLSTCKL